MTTTTGRGRRDEYALAARLAWLAGARNEEEAHLVESALLARTDNGPHEGDPRPEGDA